MRIVSLFILIIVFLVNGFAKGIEVREVVPNMEALSIESLRIIRELSFRPAFTIEQLYKKDFADKFRMREFSGRTGIPIQAAQGHFQLLEELELVNINKSSGDAANWIIDIIPLSEKCSEVKKALSNYHKGDSKKVKTIENSVKAGVAAVINKYYGEEWENIEEIKKEIEKLPDTLIEQLSSAFGYLENIHKKIDSLEGFELADREEIDEIVEYLFWETMVEAARGMKGNPIHHSWQVTETMIEIAEGEEFKYTEFKDAVALAILHDIGYGQSKTPKKRSSEVKEDPSLLEQYLQARKEHMEIGAIVATTILNSLNQRFIDEYGKSIFTPEEIKEIADAIRMHDNPSYIRAKISVLKKLKAEGKKLPMPEPGDDEIRSYLLPLDNLLVVALREADRLWMISQDGLLADLIAEPGKRTPMEQLEHNINSFKKEYELYNTYLLDRSFIEGFKGNTLFRTKTGFAIFEREKSVREKEILDEDIRLLRLSDKKLIEELIRIKRKEADLESLPKEIINSPFVPMIIRQKIMREITQILGVDLLIEDSSIRDLFDKTRADNYPGLTAFARLNKKILGDIEAILSRKAEIEETVDRAMRDSIIDKVIILGMGGSGIAPQVMKGFLAKLGYDEVQIQIVKEAEIPPEIKIDDNTMIIAASYSGTTGETLSAFQNAIMKGAKHLIVISTKRDKFAEVTQDFSFIQIPLGEKVQPREAYSFTVPINLIVINRIIEKSGKTGFWKDLDIDKGVEEIRKFLEDNPEWDELSLDILKRGLEERKSFLFVYEGTDPLLEAVALRIFQQNSECYKLIGYNIEDSKNITVESLRDNFMPIILKSKDKLTYGERYLEELDPIIISRQSKNDFANAFILEIIFTRAIYGLSLFNGRDPIPVPLIDEFKSIMKKTAEFVSTLPAQSHEFSEIMEHIGNTTPIIIATEEARDYAYDMESRLLKKGIMPIVWVSPEAWHNAINGVFPFAYGKNFSLIILETGKEKGFSKVQHEVVKEHFLKPFNPLVWLIPIEDG